MKLLGGLLLIALGAGLARWRIGDYQDNFLRALGEDLRNSVAGVSSFVAILVILALGVGLVALSLLG